MPNRMIRAAVAAVEAAKEQLKEHEEEERIARQAVVRKEESSGEADPDAGLPPAMGGVPCGPVTAESEAERGEEEQSLSGA